jgi:hypothetical protein
VRPVRAPQHTVWSRVDDRPGERNGVEKRRARGRHALGAGHLHPARVQLHQIEQRAERPLRQAAVRPDAPHVIDDEGHRDGTEQSRNLRNVCGVQVHDQMPSERSDALNDVVEYAHVRPAAEMRDEVEADAPYPTVVQRDVIRLGERRIDDRDAAVASAAGLDGVEHGAIVGPMVTGPRSLYLVRFLLGAAEAGFFPGVMLYLTYWRRSMRSAISPASARPT